MNKDIKYLVLSDIHLGHRINKSSRIYENIVYFFTKHEELIKDIDYLFLAGDFFDTFLASYSEDYLIATNALTYIITWCKSRNVKLRVLEGTPSHDWGQAKVISSIIKELNIDIDYKYIDDLCIENDHEYGINILYIPDEYKHKAEDTLKDVKKLMNDLKLTKVDIAIMHGQFNYQIPMVKLESSHDESEYLSLVDRYISIGHIHVHSSKDRIIAQGSFDRLAHNEEEPKGGVIFSINKERDKDQWIFLENKHAMIFKTVDLTNSDDVDKVIKNLTSHLPKNSAIRFIVNDKDKFLNKLQEFKKITKDYNVKIVVPDVKTLKKGEDILNHEQIKTFTITRDNIVDLVTNELNIQNVDENLKVDIVNYLNGIIK